MKEWNNEKQKKKENLFRRRKETDRGEWVIELERGEKTNKALERKKEWKRSWQNVWQKKKIEERKSKK